MREPTVLDPCPFNAEYARTHVQRLCHPRQVGTAGEKSAGVYIHREFRGEGLEVVREPLHASRAATELILRLAFTLAAAAAIAAVSLSSDLPLLAALGWGLAALLVNRPWFLRHIVPTRLFPGSKCENLVAYDPTGHDRAPARVVFMAHYDTKSQYLPTGVRIGLVTAVTVTSLLGAVLALVAAAGAPELLQLAGPWGMTITIVVALAGLNANFTGNRSPGALDNGSGVGTVLELARCWRPPENLPLEVVWVATAAEEVGLNGARAFLHAHEGWWQEKPTLLINVESVGAGNLLYFAGEHQALRLAEDLAAELGITHHRLHVLGAGLDHEPFAARGLTSVSVMGDVVRNSFHMHSPHDNMDLIDNEALARTGRFAIELATAWAEMHQPAGRRAVPSSGDVALPEPSDAAIQLPR